MPIVITHSDIAAFLRCRRQWNWSYVSDFRLPERYDGARALGTRVHSALEWYYAGHGDPIAKHQELFLADLEAADDADAPSWVIDQLNKDCIIGRNCVTGHQEWLADTGADDPYDIVGAEQEVSAEILGGRVLLKGKVDVLFRERATGFLVVNDFKTDGGRPGTREQLERSWQHHCYLIALRLSHPEDHVTSAHYTVMRKIARVASLKSPLVQRWRVPGTTRMADNKLEQLEQLCGDMLDTMEQIEATGASAAYPSPNHECQWCDFRQPCEVTDESTEAARAMLDREFIRGGRHGRYAATPSSS